MRHWIIFSAFLALKLASYSGFANPIVGPPVAPLYISSERLEVLISPKDAKFKGTFTFAAESMSDSERDMMDSFMELPIWFPQQSSNDQSVNVFWETFGTNLFNRIQPHNKGAFESAVALKVFFRRHLMPVNVFVMLYQGGNQRPFKFLTFPEWEIFRERQESGFCCLLFNIGGFREIAQKHVPVTVSYRQPLFKTSNASRHFFYLPIFANLPKNISTADTNRYCIILTAAPGCSLAVTNGLQSFIIKAGKSVILTPQDRQAIRATAMSLQSQ